MANNNLDKCITELKVCLFDMFAEKLREVNNEKKTELCELMESVNNDIHTLIGTLAEVEALQCDREKSKKG